MSEVIGLLFAVTIGLLFIPTLSTYTQTASDNTRMATTAQQQRKLIDASSSYMQQYSSNIQSVATATTPAIITVPMLQAVQLLDASFSATNPFGQTWQTQVLQPSAGNLQAFVMSFGGTAMNDKAASKIAGLVGAQGGFVPKNDSSIFAAGTAYGSYGGWTAPTTNYASISGGHLAALLTFNNGQLTSNYLYRNAVPGQPNLNRMATAIDMGGNNLNNAGAVTAGGRITTGEYLKVDGVAVENQPCSPRTIALDANGLTLSCQSGVWRGQRPTRVFQIAGTISYYTSWGVATCPSNTLLVGGGYQIAGPKTWPDGATPAPGSGGNSPDNSLPLSDTQWGVYAGGVPDFNFIAYALCAQ